MSDENYTFPDIKVTDFIDESLPKILERDEASRIGFRKSGTFPIVTEADIGFEVYKPDGGGKYRYLGNNNWKQVDKADTGTPITLEEATTNYQPKESKLTSFSSTSGKSKTIPFFASTGIVQLQDITDFFRGLFTKGSAKDVRDALNLGEAAQLNLPIDASILIQPGTITTNQLNTQDVALFWSTGDIKATFKKIAPAGWIILDDGTIGSETSGASTRANADVKDLFTVLWDLEVCTVKTIGGLDVEKGSSAEADWNNNRQLVTPKILGRVFAQSTSGFDVGSIEGTREETLSEAQMPKHFHFLSSDGGYNLRISPENYLRWYGAISHGGLPNENFEYYFQGSTNLPTLGKSQEVGGDEPHNNIQPTTYINYMVKL